MASSYTLTISATCTFDANGGNTGGGGLVGRLKSASAGVRCEAAVRVSPSMPKVFPYAPHSTSVAF
eukprot:11427850-Ditylum_brightwellii.AAC.1